MTISEYPIKMIDGSENHAQVQCKWFSDNNHLTQSTFHIDELELKKVMKKLFLFALVAFAIGCSKNEGGERGDESTYLRLHYYDWVLTAFNTSQIIRIDTDGQWKITSVPSWCECSSLTGYGETEITITVKPEFVSEEDKNAIMDVTDVLTIKAGALTETMSIHLHKMRRFYVETGGELENVLADYDYANMNWLNIRGVLNDVDFLFIYRMMPKLRQLNIAEVNITALPTQAFYKSTNVENLILPNTLTTIGEEMFYYSALRSIAIPESVETIERAAFCGCKLSSFEIPARVETTEERVFCDCKSLTSIEIPANVKTIGNEAFSKSALTSIKIPTNVETIGYGVFLSCESLKTVDMSACTQVEKIEDYAFYNDSELRLFKIGTAPPTCESYAFYGINPYSVLKVPSGCADAYKSASEWRRFASITGLDE